MEVFILHAVTIKRGSIIRYTVFLIIIAAGLCCVLIQRGIKPEAAEVKLYFVDAQMMRLIPSKASIPKTTPAKMAQRVLDELIEGRDDNPKIRRIIPKLRHSMRVTVKNKTAYVDISSAAAHSHPDGRDLELLTIYSIVNSVTSVDGITNVRFTIDGKVQKDFKGHIDMRETFIPDYFM